MMDEMYKVTVDGPKGRVYIELPANQVEYFTADTSGDMYAAALYLAYCDRWTTS